VIKLLQMTDQIEAVLKLHHYAGRFTDKGVHIIVCGCGHRIDAKTSWGFEPLTRHQAEEIAKLQV
jgi:hypothetical protein